MTEQSVAEAIVNEEWRRVLGDGTDQLDDDFFALGGTSLGALDLVEAVESRLGISLDLDILFMDGSRSALVAAVMKRAP